MDNLKAELINLLDQVQAENDKLSNALLDTVRLTDYSPEGKVWTKAFQRAIDEHQTVIIPKSGEPYLIDDSIIVPSNRKIVAEDGAVIRLKKGTDVLLLRNSMTADGTHAPITVGRNENITIIGGIWEECCDARASYGQTCKYDKDRSFFGVYTCLLLENINNLTLKNLTFRNCGGFALQIGDAKNVIIDDIVFENCFADGVHVNGNTENIRITNVRGYVGDDLVAFNAFDWQSSSINFGPCKNVFCYNLTLSLDSPYKAIRIQTGIYTFKDGSKVDCSLTNAYFGRVRNIRTFKLYCQTPRFFPDQKPEPVEVGSGDNIMFEDIVADLKEPIDLFKEYVDSHPIKGSFAVFELGLNVKNIYFKNIEVTLYRDRFPYSYVMCIGPKAVRNAVGMEVFDPSFSSVAENVQFQDLKVCGKKVNDLDGLVREIVFDHIYDDMPSTASGRIKKLSCI